VVGAVHGAHLIASDVGCIGSTARQLGRVVRPGWSGFRRLLEPPSAWTDGSRRCRRGARGPAPGWYRTQRAVIDALCPRPRSARPPPGRPTSRPGSSALSTAAPPLPRC
jgi:hypothetical protein